MPTKNGVLAVSSDRETQDASTRLARLSVFGNDEEKLKLSNDLDGADRDVENNELSPKEAEGLDPPPKSPSYASGLTWMAINTLATIGIVRVILTAPFQIIGMQNNTHH